MKAAKMFGVERKDDFYSKYIAQGCWTRCLECQRSTGISFTSASNNVFPHCVVENGETTSQYVEKCAMESSGKSGAICDICRVKGVSNLSCGMHGCGKCGSIFPKEHWPAKQVKNHKGFTRDLVCNNCAAQGYSPGNYEVHTCHECNVSSGHGKFDKDVLYKAKSRGSTKICKDTLVKWIWVF